MRIKYNLSSNRIIDRRRFILKSLSILVISLLLILAGTHLFSVVSRKNQAEVRKINQFQKSIKSLEAEVANTRDSIGKKKSKWQKEVNFLNNLLARKRLYMIKKLDFIEENLPEAILVEKISFKKKDKITIKVRISAASLESLIQLYKTLSKYNLHISNEAEKNGLHQASLQFIIHDEKD